MLITRLCGFAFVAALLGVQPAAAQPTPDQQAQMLLDAARKGYNEGNPQFAADKFKEFTQKFGNHKDAHSARLGLALAILDLPDRNFQAAIDSLNPAAGDANFVDRPLALYYLGVGYRGLGLKEIAEGIAKPNEMPQRQQAATGRFNEAAKFFGQAREAFEKKAPPDLDWVARARCDTAEMELRLNKVKEARATAEPFAKDAALAKSKYRTLGLYYHGVACFLLSDVPAAGKSLNQLAPFDQPFGPHARYLMGRVHMTQGEGPEAAAAFDGVLAGYAKQKADATELLKTPDKFKNDPWEKTRLEGLLKNPPPDYIAGSAFYAACLQYEAGKFGEAMPKFQAFAKDFAVSPLKDDAMLRSGFCFVQTKQFDEAIKTLQPLSNHPRLADQAFYWIGKAQMGQAAAADPAKPEVKLQIIGQAVVSFRTGIDRANQLQGDPEAKTRRAEMQLELADAHLTAKQAREAAQVYEAVLNEKQLPNRQEEILIRLIDAFHLAGDLPASEARVVAFKQQFPNSPLMAAALFRSAENAYARGQILAKENKPGEATTAFADAGKKYEEVIAKFPEFDKVNRARFGSGLCLVAAGNHEKAATVLEAIPGPERNGELSVANYVLADCHIRLAPAKAEDALQDNILREKLGAAAGLLEGFIAANPKAPEAPDALLKLGYCHKRLGAGLPPGNERNEFLNKARTAYERLAKEFPQSPEVGAATLERAKVIAIQGDKNQAVNALGAFRQDPLGKSPVAPLAYVTLATFLREQNKFPDAVTVLAEARQRYEGPLAADPNRIEWIGLLRYHHGVALSEAGKHGEARAAFDQAIQSAANKPIGAEAALRGCQCHAEEVKAKIAAIEKQKAMPNLKPDQIAAFDNQIKAAKLELAGVGKLYEQRAEQFRAAMPQAEARARMLYDAAWVYRTAGEDPSAVYTKLIAEFSDLALAVEARLELAELLMEKKPDDAVKLLKDAIDKEPTDKNTPQETTERIRLRLGAAQFAKKDFAAAQGQFDSVAANEKSPHRGQAIYRSAECLMAAKKYEEAKNKLVIFRDNGAFHNIAGVSDRALLRLGHSLLELKQWDAARQTFEQLIGRYGANNPWAADARYGIGTVFQNQGRFDEAVSAYAQLTQAVADERSGRAYLQIGLCRAAQKKYDDAGKAFAEVYFNYELPDLKFAGLLEHARILIEQGKTPEATKLLEKVIKDAPKDSDWTKAAQERLGKIDKK